MRTYEALYIVHPELPDEEIQTVAKQVEKLVTDDGGAIVRSEIWGKRRLAYEVNRCTEGVYVLLRFESNPGVVAKMERHFKLTEPIIRNLVVHFDEHTLRLEAEQQRRKEEEIQASAERRARGGDDDEDDDRRHSRSGSRRSHDDEEDE